MDGATEQNITFKLRVEFELCGGESQVGSAVLTTGSAMVVIDFDNVMGHFVVLSSLFDHQCGTLFYRG